MKEIIENETTFLFDYNPIDKLLSIFKDVNIPLSSNKVSNILEFYLNYSLYFKEKFAVIRQDIHSPYTFKYTTKTALQTSNEFMCYAQKRVPKWQPLILGGFSSNCSLFKEKTSYTLLDGSVDLVFDSITPIVDGNATAGRKYYYVEIETKTGAISNLNVVDALIRNILPESITFEMSKYNICKSPTTIYAFNDIAEIADYYDRIFNMVQ